MRIALATRLGVFVIARRDRRVAAQAAVGVVTTFLLVAFAPAFMLALAPIVFGVPHVASDVRYLVLRRGVSRPAIGITLAFAALVTALRVCELFAPSLLPWASLEMTLLFGWVASAAVVGARASGRLDRVVPALALVAGLALVAVPHAEGMRLLLAHLHNVIAIVVWLFVFRRSVRYAALPLALAGAAVVVLLSGVTLPWSMAHASALGTSLTDAAAWMAPGFSTRAGLAVVLSFAFLQSMHYAVWLGWIPQEDLRGEGTLSFKMSLRSMARDFGPRGFAVVAALSALVLAGGFVSMVRTRELYLSLATFHGYLEIAMLAYFVCSASATRTAESA